MNLYLALALILLALWTGTAIGIFLVSIVGGREPIARAGRGR